MRDINLAVVHCADTPETMDIGVDEIRDWHLKRGWSDIGYHYVIRRDGTLEIGRNLSKPGAHAKGFNENSIGICLVGGKEMFNFSKKQLWTLEELVKKLSGVYENLKVVGHNDLTDQKTCPQFNVKEWFKEV